MSNTRYTLGVLQQFFKKKSKKIKEKKINVLKNSLPSVFRKTLGKEDLCRVLNV
jgi:hypothetical protein